MIKLSLNMISLTAIFSLAILLINGCDLINTSTKSANPNPTPNQTITPKPNITKTPMATAIKTPSLNPLQLNIQQSFLAKKTSEGKVVLVDKGVFKRGEDIYFVLKNVGKFKKGSDGEHWLEMDLLVGNSRGKIVAARKNMLGGKGKTILKDDIAVAPYGTVNLNTKVSPGKYQIKLIIYDKIAGVSISAAKSLNIK